MSNISAEDKTTVSTATKDKIFNAASKLFAQNGYEKTSVREICDLAGVTKPTLYYYFKDKDSLFDELMEETFRISEYIKSKYIKHGDDFLSIIRSIAKIYFDFIQYYPELIRFSAFIHLSDAPSALLKKHIEFGEKKNKEILEVMKQGVKENYISPDRDLKMLANFLIAPLVLAIGQLIFHKLDEKSFKKMIFNSVEFWIESFTISKKHSEN